MQRSLQEWDEKVTIEYRPFLLNPDIPDDGYDFREYMTAKGGGRIPLEQFFDGPRRMGANVDLVFNFDQISKAPNSTKAHILISLAPKEKQSAIVEELYAAYFEHGKDIGDIDVLLSLAAGQGMDIDQLESQLSGDIHREQILHEVEQAYRLGITGVPFYVINQKYAFSGAQPPEVILDIFTQIQHKEGNQSV